MASFLGSVAEGVTGAIATDESGYLILRKGSRRLTYINELRTDKDNNATATASTIINPHWNGKTINVALGNNGRISLEQPGALAISKTVAVPAGFDEAHYNNLDFTFNISIPDAAGKTFKATVKGEDGTAHGDESWNLTFDAAGNATHTLKHGETLYVYGLARGTAYTVTEEAASGFETSPSTAQEGRIEAGLEAKAEFTNTYSATGKLSGEGNLAGVKILNGRAWLANDSFTFILQGLDGAPMPEGAEGDISRVVVKSPEGTKSGTPVAFNFGDIAYDAPGTYTYQIYEPAEEAASPSDTTGGAMHMVEYGCMENPHVDAIIALHMNPATPDHNCQFAIKKGVITSGFDLYRFDVHGKTAHGSQPQNGNDAILALSQLIVLLQQIVSRNTDPLKTAILSVGTISGGSRVNIIPDYATAGGCFRYYDNETAKVIRDHTFAIAKGVETLSGCKVDVQALTGYACVENDDKLIDLISETLTEELGENSVVWLDEPSSGSEDFSYYGLATGTPAALMWLNCEQYTGEETYALHSSKCIFKPEAIKAGAEGFVSIAIKYLNS